MSDSHYEPGTLRSVTMINFMKHSHLQIDLKPHVNFITGRNGSGKSSILVAISIGLGMTSRNSGRGSSLADKIKDGQSKAKIIIVIHNGQDGYCPERYGDKITVTRTITKTSSSYAIDGFPKGSATQVREELEKIRGYFNIQIDNPCSIMHQDIAREFISVSSPARKYDLFMRGTLLSVLADEITEIQRNITKVGSQKDQRLEEKAELDKEFSEIDRLYQIVKESDTLKERCANLEDELAWSYYVQAKQEVRSKEKDIEEVNRLIVEKKQSVDEKAQKKLKAESEFNEFNEKYREQAAQIEELKREKEKLAPQLNKIKSELSQNKIRLERQTRNIKSHRDKIEQKRKELNKSELERDRKKQDADNKLRQYIEVRETQKAQLKEELIRVEREHADLDRAHNEVAQLHNDARASARTISIRKTELESKLATMKKVQDSQANRNYGQGFAFKPIGPLSRYIKIKDQYQSWNIAAQHVIGKNLDQFVVSNHHDNTLIRQSGVNSVVIANFAHPRYQIPSPTPPCPGAIRFIDIISIQDEVVTGIVNRQQVTVHLADVIYNVIIDLGSIDRVWLIENEDLAMEAAYSGAASVAITKSGATFKIQNGYEMRQGQRYSSSKIGVDESERIGRIERDLENARMEFARADEAEKRLHREELDLKSKAKAAQNRATSISDKITRLDTELRNPPQSSSDVDDKIMLLRTSIDQLEADIKADEREVVELEQRIQDNEAAKHEIVDKIKAVVERMPQQNTSKQESDTLYRTLKTAEREQKHEEEELAHLNSRLQREERNLQELQQKAEGVLADARKHSPAREEEFKDHTRPQPTLMKLLEEERRKYQAAQAESGLDFNEVKHRYELTAKKVKKAERYISELAEFIRRAEEAMENRIQKLQEMRSSITRRTKVSFQQYQNKRKYTGKLKIQHDTKQINIAVKQNTDNSYIDVSGLSGGEKSFCLVSLLLSLWDVMECPFYCVDEFDVFMDEINRQAATKLLVNGAQGMCNRQFIFITPLNLDHLKNEGEGVTVFEVATPTE